MDVLLPGTQFDPQGALAKGLVDEVVPDPRGARPGREGVDPRRTATTRTRRRTRGTAPGYKMPGGTPKTPALAQFLPAFPALLRKQPKGADLPGAARDHVRRRRGCAGRLRHRVAHRDALLHQPGRQPAGQEHDPGVLLRPAGDQLRLAAPAGHRALAGHQGRRPRRRDDGRRHRLLCARAGMEVVLKDVSLEAAEKGKAYSAKLNDKGVSRGKLTAGEGRRAARPDHRRPPTPPTSPAATWSSRPSSRTRRSRPRSSPRWRRTSTPTRCCAPTPRRCRSPSSPAASTARPTSSACTSSAPSTRCRWSRSSAARRPPTSRWPRRTTSCSRSARRRSWSTTAAASTPRASSAPRSTRAWRCSPRACTRCRSSGPRRRPATRSGRCRSATSSTWS